MIFNIQRFSTHDGEGIRTMIFYKGCPLRCQWCSNPESQLTGYSLMYDRRKCRSFGDCLKTEPDAITVGSNGILINRAAIPDPLKLRDCCLSRALTVAGENKNTDELLLEIEKDLPFYYGSNGGITLSGGEPLSQGSNLVAFLRELKKQNIDVSVETSLHVNWQMVERCLGLMGTYLVDLKHTNKEKFSHYTQGDLALVLANLGKLADCKENIIIRIPVIPSFNHTETEMKDIIDFTATISPVREIHFIPYHTLGIEKYAMLGMKYVFENKKPVDPAELAGYVQYAQNKGLRTRIGG